MTSTVFQSGTVIESPWLNDVNAATYTTVPSNTASIATLNGATGAANVGYTPAGTGAVATNVQAKLRQTVSVKDFGAVGNGVTNDSAAFIAAIDSLSVYGGKIIVGPGTWLLNTEPTWGTKSIFWDIDPSAIFTGAGTVGNESFPRATTNTSMYPVGPFIQSQSTTTSTANNATGAFVVEVLQPAGMNAGTVGIYGAAQSANSGANSNIWAANFLSKSLTGATGGVWGLEIDVDCNSAAALHFGLDITGIGTFNPDFGLIIQRADATVWDVGIEIRNASVALNLNGSNMTRGIVINSPSIQQNSLFSGKGLVNNSTLFQLQRFTDTSPTGYFLSFVDNINNDQLYSVDISGNVVGNSLTVKGAATSTFTGALQLGNTTSLTATLGGATLPTNPTGFLNAFLGNVQIKIPYYSA